MEATSGKVEMVKPSRMRKVRDIRMVKWVGGRESASWPSRSDRISIMSLMVSLAIAMVPCCEKVVAVYVVVVILLCVCDVVMVNIIICNSIE